MYDMLAQNLQGEREKEYSDAGCYIRPLTIDLALVFGMPGCLNDIKLVDASKLLTKIAAGKFLPP